MKTKGSTSCVAVQLREITKVLDPSAIVYISRQQARQLGLIGLRVDMTARRKEQELVDEAMKDFISVVLSTDEPERKAKKK